MQLARDIRNPSVCALKAVEIQSKGQFYYSTGGGIEVTQIFNALWS